MAGGIRKAGTTIAKAIIERAKKKKEEELNEAFVSSLERASKDGTFKLETVLRDPVTGLARSQKDISNFLSAFETVTEFSTKETPEEESLRKAREEAILLGADVPKDASLSDIGKILRDTKIAEKEKASAIQINKETQAQEKKKQTEFKRNRKIANLKLIQTFRKFDEMTDKTQEITKLPPGRISGAATYFLGITGINPEVAQFLGQLVETSTAIAKIAAPSAKVGPDLIKLFSTTLPKIWSNFEEAKGQISTSLANAFATDVGANPEKYLSDEEFKTLSAVEMDTRLSEIIKTFEDEMDIFLNKLAKHEKQKSGKTGKLTQTQRKTMIEKIKKKRGQ